MKIYKSIEASELETYTSNGWLLHSEPLRQTKLFEHEDRRGRVPTDAERARGVYYTVYDPPTVHQGDVLIFIVWKEFERITKEASLTEELHQAINRASVAENNVKRLEEQNALQLEVIENEKKVTETQRNAKIDAQERYKKLEGDLAKVRKAIGDLKMKEIVG